LQYVRAKHLLSENKDKLTSLAEKLLEKEVIFKEDLIAIFGERPWDILLAEEQLKEAAKKAVEDANTSTDKVEETVTNENVEEQKKEEHKPMGY
jgi:hypothetical protein